MITNLSNVRQALLEAELVQKHWIDGGWEALADLYAEPSDWEEILNIFSLVDQVEPEIKIRVRIILHNWIYCVPLLDVSSVVDINKVLHIEKEDLYLDWRSRIGSNKGNILRSTQTTDHKGITWNKTQYIDDKGDTRVLYERI